MAGKGAKRRITRANVGTDGVRPASMLRPCRRLGFFGNLPSEKSTAGEGA